MFHGTARWKWPSNSRSFCWEHWKNWVAQAGCNKRWLPEIPHFSWFSIAFQFCLLSEYIFGCPCFREAKILKEPVTESPEQFSTQRFTGVPSFWWVVKKTRVVGCFRSAAMTAHR